MLLRFAEAGAQKTSVKIEGNDRLRFRAPRLQGSHYAQST